MIAEFERMGARMLSPDEAAQITEFAFGCGEKVSMDGVGRKAPELAARAGFSVPPATKILLAPLPSDLDELAAHPLVQEKLMPVLGVVRARDSGHAIDVAVLVTEHRGTGPQVGDLRRRPGRDRHLQPGGPHRPGQRHIPAAYPALQRSPASGNYSTSWACRGRYASSDGLLRHRRRRRRLRQYLTAVDQEIVSGDVGGLVAGEP